MRTNYRFYRLFRPIRESGIRADPKFDSKPCPSAKTKRPIFYLVPSLIFRCIAFENRTRGYREKSVRAHLPHVRVDEITSWPSFSVWHRPSAVNQTVHFHRHRRIPSENSKCCARGGFFWPVPIRREMNSASNDVEFIHLFVCSRYARIDQSPKTEENTLFFLPAN